MNDDKKNKILNVSIYLIKVIRQVLNNQEADPIGENEGFSYRDVYLLSKFHQVENIVYFGLEKYLKDQELIKVWKKKSLQNITMSLVQEEEKNKLSDLFERNQIDFMPVKGYYIRSLYPRSDFRFMSDLDILIDEKKAKFAKKLMIKEGYQVDEFNYYNHDEYTKKPFMHVELHRSLVTRDHENYFYYKNILKETNLKEKTNYFHQLSNEKLYIYHLVHLKKHYESGGAGIRNFIDIYLYLKSEILDLDYINQKIEKLNLKEFKEQMERVSNQWFGEEESTEDLEQIKQYIIQSGVYGTTAHLVDNNIKKEKSSAKMILSRLFPSPKRMKALYPILNKCILFLPFCYIARVFRGIRKRKKVTSELKVINNKNNNKE